MKKSAWYSGLWRKKLNDLPVKDDADMAWLEMNQLLDKHMPNSGGGGSGIKKFIGAKAVSLLIYILPAAAMVGTVSYFSLHDSATKKIKVEHDKAGAYNLKNKLKQGPLSQPDSGSVKDSLSNSSLTDSLTGLHSLGTGNVVSGIGNTTMPVGRKPQSHSVNAGLNKTANTWVASSNSLTPGTINVPKNEPDSSGSDTQNNLDRKNGLPNNVDQKALNSNDGQVIRNTQTEPNAGTGSLPLNDGISNVTSGSQKGDNGAIAKDQKNRSAKVSKAGQYSLLKKPSRNKLKQPQETILSGYNFGLETGLGFPKNFYAGITGTYVVNKKWLLNSGLRLDINRGIAGTHTHRSFIPVDSTFFNVYDSRRITSITIPVDVEYRISKSVSIHAGPNISYALKQSHILSKLGAISNYRDTLGKTQSIDSAFKHSAVSKFTAGVSAGVSLRMGKFLLDSRYLQNITPYRVNTGLGEYKKYYGSFQVGIRYQFKTN